MNYIGRFFTVSATNDSLIATFFLGKTKRKATTSRSFAAELAATQLALVNPAAQETVYQFRKTTPQPWSLEVFTLAGQRVQSSVVDQPVGLAEGVLTLDPALVNGLYRVVLKDHTGGLQAAGKLVVNR
jgi:hypothetical protein